jgi:hypothetical protein
MVLQLERLKRAKLLGYLATGTSDVKLLKTEIKTGLVHRQLKKRLLILFRSGNMDQLAVGKDEPPKQNSDLKKSEMCCL